MQSRTIFQTNPARLPHFERILLILGHSILLLLYFVFKEIQSTERSDKKNWIKDAIIATGRYTLDIIEGCSQNNSNRTTHLLDRVLVEIKDETGSDHPDENWITNFLKEIDEESIKRKASFADSIGAEYDYIFYAGPPFRIYRYRVYPDLRSSFQGYYGNVKDFADWLLEIKQWHSYKPYENIEDLPSLDGALRKAGCPWPANIDGLLGDSIGHPLMLIEFQYADRKKDAPVREHSNNKWFYPSPPHKDDGMFDEQGNLQLRAKDHRRWQTIELLRKASRMPYFVFTWAEEENICLIRQIRHVCFANYSKREDEDGYLKDLYQYYHGHEIGMQGYREFGKNVLKNRRSFAFITDANSIKRITFDPPLRYSLGRFPYIYFTDPIEATKENVVQVVDRIINHLTNTK